MSSRFGRDPARTSLFSSYDASTNSTSAHTSRSSSPSKSKSKPKRPASGYGYGFNAGGASSSPYAQPYGGNTTSQAYGNSPSYGNEGGDRGFSAYPGNSGGAGEAPGFRSATPNSRGQYSTAVLDELESQNEEQAGMLIGKVRDLKHLTTLIGAEIRDSSALAEKMNDQFENSRLKIRGTMNRMLRMAEKTGVGWKAWVGFFIFVVVVFWYVWLF